MVDAMTRANVGLVQKRAELAMADATMLDPEAVEVLARTSGPPRNAKEQ